MKNFEEQPQQGKEDKKISRREFLKAFGIGMGAAMCFDVKSAFTQESGKPSRYENGWLYTAEDMQDIYEREYYGTKLLQNTFERKGKKMDWNYSRGGVCCTPRVY